MSESVKQATDNLAQALELDEVRADLLSKFVDAISNANLYDIHDLKNVLDPNCMSIHWCTDDVRHASDYELTEEECRRALGYANARHDAEWGITWETLRVHAEYVYEERTTNNQNNQ